MLEKQRFLPVCNWRSLLTAGNLKYLVSALQRSYDILNVDVLKAKLKKPHFVQ